MGPDTVQSMSIRHASIPVALLLVLGGCAPTTTWRCRTHQVNEGNDLIRLSIQLDRQFGESGQYETVSSPTILFRRGQAASMVIQSEDFHFDLMIPPQQGTKDLRVTVNGTPIEVIPDPTTTSTDPEKQDSEETG